MKTSWWHRLFIVLEIGLMILGTIGFALVVYDNPATPWWGALVSWIPAFLMRVLHAVTAYVVEG